MAPFIGTARKCSAVNVEEQEAREQQEHTRIISGLWRSGNDDDRREGSVVSSARHNSGADIAPKKLKRIFARCLSGSLTSVHPYPG